MKRGIKFLIAGLFMMPLGVNAATLDVSLSCPNSANANSEISCVISATPNGSDLKGIEAKFDITGATYSSFSLEGGWTSYSSTQIGISLAKNEATTTTTNVGTLKVKMPASGNAVVKLVEVAGANSAYDTLTSAGTSKTIRVKSNINTLESLSISGATINFDKNNTNYNVTIDSSTATIEASKTDQYSTVTGTGNKTLNYGNNSFNIDVTAEDGTKKTYTINVTRPDNRSTNNNLSTLTISNGEINFNRDTTNYNVEVDTDKITIGATIEDPKASFVGNYGPRTVNLKYGKNTIKIKVRSEKEIEKEYVINVTRKDNRNNNNNLSNITLSSGNLLFNKDITEYQVSVDYEVETITISALTENPKAKVEFPNSVNLQIGNNEIIIKVIAENETTKEYKINVIRKEKNQILDTNNYLKTLNIAGYDIKFNKNTSTYEVVIKEETKLNITFVPESDKALATLTGNENLKDGSTIKISVYAEDGNIREYKINVIKETKEEGISLPIAIGVFAVGLLTFIGSVCYIKSR